MMTMMHFARHHGGGLPKQCALVSGSQQFWYHSVSKDRDIEQGKNNARTPLFLEHSKWKIDNYGISASLIDEQTLLTIRQLPEVADVLESPPVNANEENTATEKLRRAVEIFRGTNPGGKEHVACLSMLVETTGVIGSSESDVILDEMLSTHNPPKELLLLAKAKSAYYKGDFALARSISEKILRCDPSSQPVGTVEAARTIVGASRLQDMQSIDDAFSVRDPFRVILKRLERGQPGNKLAIAAAHLNLGTAEAIYAQAVSKFNNVNVPLDSALRSWKQGSAIISSMKSCDVLKARCLTNMSWGLIQMANESGDVEYLKQASEHAQKALACYKGVSVQDGIGRTLCSLGVCAHKSGQPVTAQGLFASALDQENESIVGKLNFIETLGCYANLLDDWERRENEAMVMRERIGLVSAGMTKGWRDRSVISGSLWLFGLGLFH